MTIKKLLFFGCLYAALLLGLETCIGTHGLTYLHALQREVADLSYEREEKQLRNQSLASRQAELERGEGLQDAAIRLGYQQEGEQVYFLGGTQSPPATAEDVPRRETYAYFHLPLWGNALIALGVWLLVLCGYVGIKRGRGNDDE